ncbi:MAG: hypothetical protein FRX48_03467 [Lasallia pustulata]|uniref:Uncharacterized protein n=1 Tax=Lasallia pustulata TaxID=136370 RepID=A0A5M8PSD5_9LECA|nr:MAG: hypothetical protein FRX48_03467 [Lasallia pustulata]
MAVYPEVLSDQNRLILLQPHRPSPPTDCGLCSHSLSPKKLETALVALLESVANALRILNDFYSCCCQERSELLVVQSVEGLGSEAPSGSNKEFV